MLNSSWNSTENSIAFFFFEASTAEDTVDLIILGELVL